MKHVLLSFLVLISTTINCLCNPTKKSGDGKIGLERIDLGRIGLGRIDLGRIGLGRIGLGRIGLGRIGLGRIDLGRIGLGRISTGEDEEKVKIRSIGDRQTWVRRYDLESCCCVRAENKSSLVANGKVINSREGIKFGTIVSSPIVSSPIVSNPIVSSPYCFQAREHDLYCNFRVTIPTIDSYGIGHQLKWKGEPGITHPFDVSFDEEANQPSSRNINSGSIGKQIKRSGSIECNQNFIR